MYGINDDHIQRRLLSEENDKLTLARAIELAASMEEAAKDVAELQQTGVEGPVHKVQPVASDWQSPSAGGFRCGRNHGATDCRFIDAVCHNCRKRGHLARKFCSAKQSRQSRGNKQGAAHKLEDDKDEEDFAHMLYNLDEEERVEPYREQQE